MLSSTVIGATLCVMLVNDEVVLIGSGWFIKSHP